MTINCDWLPLTRRFLLRPIYSIHESPSSPARHNQQSVIPFHSSRIAFYSTPSRTSARTEIGRAGLRNPTPCIETSARVCEQSGFWGGSFVTARWRDRLIPLRRIGIFLVDVRDCDYFVFVFFLVHVRGTTLRTSFCID